ncbi:hypothetical protein DU508_23180 [Pedobacter chinensis]|uniref:Alkyl hydroperoxide reductase subunit C/ Thiol specific antioxidant domain-containing protein n=1 Tax=Pedobacter chinensis TaxID=2282421 RepID=A0A369PTT5_9SPHI|nr:redoxin domain-containing protein [Pedobacter chinensis]RDC54139.1 hypothetical protein DU508_23180 [Pedobacter chinensis]
MKKYFCLIILIPVLMKAKAQETGKNYPEVGKPMPGFKFNEVMYFTKDTVSNSDFEGQWLVLDCWNRYCSLCLKKMPALDKMRETFNKKVIFLLVGYNGSRYTKRSDDTAIRKLYEMNRLDQHLNLAIAYDSVMFHQFDIGPCPYMIIVDPKGIVRAITTSLSEPDLHNLMENKPVVFNRAYRRGERILKELK